MRPPARARYFRASTRSPQGPLEGHLAAAAALKGRSWVEPRRGASGRRGSVLFCRKGGRPATEGFRDGAGATQLDSVSADPPNAKPMSFPTPRGARRLDGGLAL